MRKTFVYASLLVAVVGFLFFFAGSCTKSDGLPPYYIKFNLDGNEVVFDLGMNGIEKDPFASVSNNVGGGTFTTLFFATPETIDFPGIPGNYILIQIYGGDPSQIPYPLTYTFPSGENVSLKIVYQYEAFGFQYSLESGSLTVTSFGEVGEAISGTFSASLFYYTINSQGVKIAALTTQVTEGEFKVKRAPNDTYPFPY